MYNKVLKYIDNLSCDYNSGLKYRSIRIVMYCLVNGFIDALELSYDDMLYISCKLLDFLEYDGEENHV